VYALAGALVHQDLIGLPSMLANLPPEVILTRARNAGPPYNISMAVYCGCTRSQPPKKSRLFPRHGLPATRAKIKALSMTKFIAANIPNIPLRNIETNARRKPQVSHRQRGVGQIPTPDSFNCQEDKVKGEEIRTCERPATESTQIKRSGNPPLFTDR
jgi:hypothetical protein